MRTGSKTFRRKASGWMFSIGCPLTLMRPRPCFAKATAVAVFFLLTKDTQNIVVRCLFFNNSNYYSAKAIHGNDAKYNKGLDDRLCTTQKNSSFFLIYFRLPHHSLSKNLNRICSWHGGDMYLCDYTCCRSQTEERFRTRQTRAGSCRGASGKARRSQTHRPGRVSWISSKPVKSQTVNLR